ncbi:6427_t:CDS:2 [Diversispora eburnea]|uniref:6427_t:CDS:1 n=1 Tax=Diversispora eburnea TaxID=1213867 RepID=A0A9N8VSL3_9GLOM|nr:6427_t:CDS:2 [Diversispora eburnea]
MPKMKTELPSKMLNSRENNNLAGNPVSLNGLRNPQRSRNITAPTVDVLLEVSNPISLLNELQQRFKTFKPPLYAFSTDQYGGFICELEVFGKIYKNSKSRPRKQEAKEDAALLAISEIVKQNIPEITESLNKDLIEMYDPGMRNELTFIPKSQTWFQKQLKDWPGKKPRVILLEFCQMHHLPTPMYVERNDIIGFLFDCRVGERIFNSDNKNFCKQADAKDYIAAKTFSILYEEFCELERRIEANSRQIETNLH